MVIAMMATSTLRSFQDLVHNAMREEENYDFNNIDSDEFDDSWYQLIILMDL